MIFLSRNQIVLLLWWHCRKVLNVKMKLYILTPLRLFSRLISIAERTKKFKEYFNYELTQEPTSLFKDGFMRESHKSDLKNILIENAHNFETYPTNKFVVCIKYYGIKIVLIVWSLINIVSTYKIITVHVL